MVATPDEEPTDPGAPPGWHVNPSSPNQHAPIVVLSLLGLGVSILVALREAGVVEMLWEPFRMTNDAGLPERTALPLLGPELGLFAFSVTLVTALVGGRRRWRERPYATLASAVAIGLTAGASVARWILQPSYAGGFSTLIFVSTVAAVAMLPLAVDEAWAARMFLRSRWPSRAASRFRFRLRPLRDDHFRESLGYLAGATGIFLGLWMILAPVVLGYRGAAVAHDQRIGPIIATIGALSLAQVARPVRWLNVALGLWLLVAPAILEYALVSVIHSITMGLLLAFGAGTFGSDDQTRRAPHAK